MTILIITTVGLAGLFGFCLVGYTFLYRLNIAKPLKWVGAVIGGLALGAVLAAITLMIIWPPVNGFFTVAGLAIIVALSLAVALPGGQKEEIRTMGTGGARGMQIPAFSGARSKYGSRPKQDI